MDKQSKKKKETAHSDDEEEPPPAQQVWELSQDLFKNAFNNKIARLSNNI